MWANNRSSVDIKAYEEKKEISSRPLLINSVSALIGRKIG